LCSRTAEARWSASVGWGISSSQAVAPGHVSLALCQTCVPSCSTAVLAKAAGSGARIFYSVAPSDVTPQHFPDSYCWESECSEDSSRLEPTTGGTEVFCLRGERSLCQPVSKSVQPSSSGSCVHSYSYPWGKFCSYCCLAELRLWKGQSYRS
jgi:hypothetical protein